MGAKPHPETNLMAASSLKIEVGVQGMEWTVSWAVTWRTIGGGHYRAFRVTREQRFPLTPCIHFLSPTCTLCHHALVVFVHFFSSPTRLYLSCISKSQGQASPPSPQGICIASPVAFSICKYPGLASCGASLDINHAPSSPSSSIPKFC